MTLLVFLMKSSEVDVAAAEAALQALVAKLVI